MSLLQCPGVGANSKCTEFMKHVLYYKMSKTQTFISYRHEWKPKDVSNKRTVIKKKRNVTWHCGLQNCDLLNASLSLLPRRTADEPGRHVRVAQRVSRSWRRITHARMHLYSCMCRYNMPVYTPGHVEVTYGNGTHTQESVAAPDGWF